MSWLPALGPRGEGWVAIQVVIFAAIAWSGWVAPGPASGSPMAAAIGSAIVVAGAILSVAGVLGLRRHDALTAVPHPRDDGRLAESGVYALVRHPIYGGLILGALGWAIVRDSLGALAGAIVLFAFFDLKRRREEAWLETRYPGYAAYRSRTRRLIPWLY